MTVFQRYKLIVELVGISYGSNMNISYQTYAHLMGKNHMGDIKPQSSLVETDMTKERLKLANEIWKNIMTMYTTDTLKLSFESGCGSWSSMDEARTLIHKLMRRNKRKV